MYIDSKKFDYRKFSYHDSDKLVERDKEFLKEAYLKWIQGAVDDIVERQWEVDDIGVVERSGDFVKLLKEAEFTYSLGAYTSTISLVGVCAEDLCRFFASFAGHNLDSLTQFDRVNRLVSLGAVTQDVADKFHIIRGLRNDCLHYNQGFKQKDQATLKADSLTALNSLKHIYGQILRVVDYATVDSSKLIDIMSRISEEAANSDPGGKLGIDGATIRTRNVFANAFGIDISMNNAGRPVFKTSIYQVEDIDSDNEPFEISLRDLSCGLIVIVDITEGDLERIKGESIKVGSAVAATLMSIPNNLEVTAEWRLTGSVRKIG
ncbi:hypothetical protein [Zhongshania sp. BJYM1]|uniref:hypothetical protein n=1 Tax=Zhongshania aquatica TaxID=2965069 RepID=UPI0022B3BEC3|nr:hypothetical protein [Marortus sp. BJYM1]